MGVLLQVISGVLLILVGCSKADERQWRQIREAPPPNTTEINNRDLNKILKVDPKTEFLETKPPKSATSLSGLPLKLGKNHYKIESTSAPIHNDSQTNWTQKSSTAYDLDHFQGTRHPSFDTNSELTTPTTKFDNKYHETVKSVKLKVDFDNESGNNDEDDNDDDDGEEDEEDGEVAKSEHGKMEFEKTKTIVDNETVSKNSIHKDLSIEQTMKINYKNVYNESEVYDQEIIEKNGTTERIDRSSSSTTEPTVTIPTTTTTKPEILPIIDNNIASESVASLSNVSKPIQTTTTTTEATSTVSVEDNIILSSSPSLKKSEVTLVATPAPITTTTTSMTTTVIHPTTTEEVPTTIQVETETIPTTTTEDTETTTVIMEAPATLSESTRTSKSLDNSIVAEQSIRDTSVKNVEVSERGLVDDLITTTAAVSVEEIKFINNTIKKVNDATTTTAATTTLAASTEETTTILPASTEEATTILPVSELTTDKVETTTEAAETTTIEEVTTQTSVTEEVLKIVETTQIPTTSTTQPAPTTTEIAFVHIKEDDSEPTTLLPTTSPSVNYSSSVSPVPVVRMVESSSEVVVPVSPRENEASTEDSATTIETTTETVSSDEEYIKDSNDGGNKKKIVAIVIASVCAVCLVLLAGLLHVMRKRQKRLNYGPRCRPVSLDDYSIDNLSVYNSGRRKGGARMSKRSFGNPAFEDPVATSHPLNFLALAKFSANLEDIKAEFEDIPQISARTSELPEGCDTKNRYANVIPLPETRVFLNSIDGYPNSDYINANYVTGPNNTKGYYIATQGPMHNTVDDFWRMIWEQQAKVILMLTHLVENGLEKCVDYLPESEVLECSRMFGDFQITLKKREVKDKYIISGLQLKNMVSNSWREVTHFWYLGWPEKGVPSEANSLIAFIIEARSYMKNGTLDKKNASNGLSNAQNDHSPVVVHCSPGTGRTGVVIACDIAIREFEKTRLVDIPKIVYKIRRDRANAVQTKEQYIFIYKVVNLYATKLTGGALENL